MKRFRLWAGDPIQSHMQLQSIKALEMEGWIVVDQQNSGLWCNPEIPRYSDVFLSKPM